MVFAAGVTGLAGCASGSGGSPGEPADTAGTAVSSVTASSASPTPPRSPSLSPSAPVGSSPAPATGPEQKLVTMTVSGGLAGVHQQVTLRGDGSVRTSDKGESVVRRASAARFDELRTLLADPALADVPDVTRDMGAADMFQYTLRFDGRTVVTDRSAGEPALDRLIDALAEWLPGHRPRVPVSR
ncbi:hypothetical protein F7R91_10205 [Streptomyces luteolifulvus]|uniref:Uncharacterized protein n=2 Tax=Streptomyces luteolifulvus TaxID=2615112 RepID=A0A6H9V2B6_9ACTN|nr:hypothetical protein F7R91_10205 [Streptomyces luteolifulvus]